WLSGSTYGRTLPQVVPVAIALALVAPLAIAWHRRLDLMSLDEDAPRVLGLALGRDRLVALVGAAVVSAAAVSAIGVLGFVGLVAPHAARALVGGYHRRVLPVAALLGAALVSVADTVGRSVIAPGQIPAGLVTALLGAPYFLWLLWRTRNPIRGWADGPGGRAPAPAGGRCPPPPRSPPGWWPPCSPPRTSCGSCGGPPPRSEDELMAEESADTTELDAIPTFVAEVVAVQQNAPRMKRITVGGDDL